MNSLEELNFSRNRMNKQELQFFSSKISSIRLYEISLNDFYEPETDAYI